MPSADSAQRPLSSPRHLHVFLASPGDVADERGLAVRVLNGLPLDPLLRGKVTLEAVAWDHPDSKTPFLTGLSAQESVIRSLGKPSACDIVVVILWSRLGSPIEQKQYLKPDGSGYFSGTEWEYEEAWCAYRKEGKPLILFYHRTSDPEAPLNPANRQAILDRLDQLESVATFLKACHDRDGSIPNEYRTPSEFEDKLRDHLKEQIRNILERQERPQPVAVVAIPQVWQGSPFPGLRSFTDQEEPIFFGRGRETDDLLRHLAEPAHRFVTIVGASGSGKSSLVWAGLIPRLQRGALEGSQEWVWVRCTPGEVGDNPFMALAMPFKGALQTRGQPPRELAEKLEKDPATLAQLRDLALAGKPTWAELLLFIDQFEELFTLTAPRYVGAFVDLLHQAAHTERIRVVATLRADFYHRCVEQLPLAELLRTGSYPLAAPGPGTLHEMITRPAEQAGLIFEPGLVERILDDTGSEPGALALMAFALAELYEAKTDDGRLTQATYDSFKGVPGAIGKRAEDTFNAQPPAVQNTLGVIFRDLVEVDEHNVVTRRRAPLSQVMHSEDSKTLIEALIKARLMVTSDSEGHEPMVEVAHEALFRSWPRLAQWVQETADDHRLRRQIRQLAAYWGAHQRQDEHRWPDNRVAEVVKMLDHLGLQAEDFSPLEQAFLGPLDPGLMREELNDPATSHEQRASIGVRLALLGDTRRGVRLRDGLPDIDWCPIEGGEVTLLIRSDPNDPNSEVVNRLTRAIESFWMGRYPVTVTQFQAFLQECYRDGQWRLPPGSPVNLPDDYPPPKHRARHGNHPADSVNWWDTILFCHWLSACLGCEVRLPTEYEWQLAATGGDSERTYPWGPDWDPPQEPWRANTYESGLSRSTAVGMYPAGASPAGVLDMTGTIWEWCFNAFDAPDEEGFPSTQDDRRVVRGGSWGDGPAGARSAYRRGGDPDARLGYVGFRVVCSSPILS